MFCPSAAPEDQQATDATYAGSANHYVGCAGPVSLTASGPYLTFDPTSISGGDDRGLIGVSGIYSPFLERGAMFPGYSKRRATSPADIGDGMSNTIAVGESSRSVVPGVFRAHRAGWTFGSTGIPTGGIFVPQRTFAVTSIGGDAINATRDYLTETQSENTHCFNSNHPGGSQFLFADGSTRFIAQELAIETLRSLGSSNGSEVIQDF